MTTPHIDQAKDLIAQQSNLPEAELSHVERLLRRVVVEHDLLVAELRSRQPMLVSYDVARGPDITRSAWFCTRCKAMVIGGRCQCETSPSPWMRVTPPAPRPEGQ